MSTHIADEVSVLKIYFQQYLSIYKQHNTVFFTFVFAFSFTDYDAKWMFNIMSIFNTTRCSKCHLKYNNTKKVMK